MSQAALRGDAPDRTPIEVVLTVPRETLATTDVTDATIPAIGAFGDGTGVSAETARRLACDCGVVHLTEDADGQIELRDGALCFIHHGQPLPPEPPRTVDTALGWPTIRADNADLEITAATGQCAWDGRPVDYELVVDSLLNLAQKFARDRGRVVDEFDEDGEDRYRLVLWPEDVKSAVDIRQPR